MYASGKHSVTIFLHFSLELLMLLKHWSNSEILDPWLIMKLIIIFVSFILFRLLIEIVCLRWCWNTIDEPRTKNRFLVFCFFGIEKRYKIGTRLKRSKFTPSVRYIWKSMYPPSFLDMDTSNRWRKFWSFEFRANFVTLFNIAKN